MSQSLRQDETVPSDIAAAWDRHSAAYQEAARLSTLIAHYGPDIPTEAELRLLGDLRGKKVLELGCGGAQCSIAFAKQGARAIGVDFSAAQLDFARQLCDQEDVRVELRQGDLADLAFLRADSIDLVFSAYAFGFVPDLNRVFRQVHRVLKVGAPLVFSLTHPAYDMIDDVAEPALLVRRSYFDHSRMDFDWAGLSFAAYHHTFSEIYMGLMRASYRVDVILEPEPSPGVPRGYAWRETYNFVPRTLIVRARKEGS
jgi:ubiquinone/menaquinone biosynthesis C-methylase UbiE